MICTAHDKLTALFVLHIDEVAVHPTELHDVVVNFTFQDEIVPTLVDFRATVSTVVL
jgi:hypothetical protein